MSIKTPVTIIVLLVILGSLSGCTLFQGTKFTLLSTSVIDGEGFPGLSLRFNTTGKTTVKVYNPYNQVLFSDVYYFGTHTATPYLGGFRKTPPGGMYTVKAFDQNNNEVFTQPLHFEGQDLSITDFEDSWWQEQSAYSLVGITLMVRNDGDLPSYPHKAQIIIDGVVSSGYLLPTVVLPSQSSQLQGFVYQSDISMEEHLVNFTVRDLDNVIVGSAASTVIPQVNVETVAFQWNYQGTNRLTLPDLGFLYEYYSGLDRLILEDYAAYIFDLYDDDFIDFLRNRLMSITDITGDIERINFIASFVQRMEYAEDDENDETCEYPRYPVEMLVDEQGDCEDKAILVAALLDSLAYNVSLLRLPNHMAVGVHLDENASVFDYYIDEYYYLEATRFPSPLGSVPSEYKDLTNVTIHPLAARPILIHSWENATRFSGTDGSDYVRLRIIVENVGRTTAQDIEVTGAFYTQSETGLNQESSLLSSLFPGEKKELTLHVNVPQGISTTLKTQIYLDNVLVHEKESSDHFP